MKKPKSALIDQKTNPRGPECPSTHLTGQKSKPLQDPLESSSSSPRNLEFTMKNKSVLFDQNINPRGPEYPSTHPTVQKSNPETGFYNEIPKSAWIDQKTNPQSPEYPSTHPTVQKSKLSQLHLNCNPEPRNYKET